MTDGEQDPVARLLEETVGSISAAVSPPDWREVVGQRARRRKNRHRRQMTRGAAVAAAAAVIAVALAVLPGAGGHQRAPVYHARFGTHPLRLLDLPVVRNEVPALARTHLVTRTMRLKTANHASIAFGAHSVWVLAPRGAQTRPPCGRLVRVDTTSARVTGSVPIRLCPAAVAYGDGSAWVLSFQIGVPGYQLTQVNPVTLAITSEHTIDPGTTPAGDTGAKYVFVAAADGSVFVAVPRGGGGEITTLDAATGRLRHAAVIPAGQGPVTAMAANRTVLWAGTVRGWVLGVDPATGTVRTARRAGTRVVSLAASAAGVWVSVNLPVPAHARYPGLDILRLNPATGALVADTGLPMTFVGTDGTSVWALGSAPPYASQNGLAVQIDPATGAIIRRADLPAPGYQDPDTLGVYARRAWVINDFLGTLTRITP